MTGEIKIDGEVLQGHANKVDAYRGDVAQALDAVSGLNLGGGAFGVMCSWMVPAALLASNAVVTEIREVRDAFQRTSSALGETVESFDSAENAHISALNAVDGHMR